MIKGCFITGTDTEVGKTIITAGLLRTFLRNGIDAVAIKPVQTGCPRDDKTGTLIAPDELVYHDAIKFLNYPNNYTHVLQKFEPACSPHLAAEHAKEDIDISKISEFVEARNEIFSLIEGAGGILVPLNGKSTNLDLMKRLDLPVILVAANKLGAINHTLLSIDLLRNAGLSVSGIIINHISDTDDEESLMIRKNNIKTIREHGKCEILAEIPFVDDFQNEESWRKIENLLLPAVNKLMNNKPDEDTKNLINFDKKHIWHPYTSAKNPIPAYPIKSANGVYLNTYDNKTLIDGMASWWCAIHGYNNPELNEAAKTQINKMSHVMFGGITHAPAVTLAKNLLELAPDSMKHVFFSDSGSISVEVAIKMALQYWVAKGKPHKSRLLTIRGGYHGDTFGAMSVCDPVNGMHSLFSDVLPKHIFVKRPDCKFHEPFNRDSISEMEQAITENHESIAAVILEPIVQGAGGMYFYHPEYLNELHKLCDKHNVLLIFDEIATGFGRTGKLFATDWTEVQPDILCLGKAITGGYITMAATLTTHEVAHGISEDGGVFMHGPTYMANPLACSIANASLEIIKRGNWQNQVKNIEKCLKKALELCRNFNEVADVRILGAIGVVEMKNPVNVAKIKKYFVDNGVWIRPFGKLIYLMPPYIITEQDISKLGEVIHEAIKRKEYK